MTLMSSADIRRLGLPSQRGKKILAQGKGAQRLPPWVTARPQQQLSSFHGSPRQPAGWRGEPWKEESNSLLRYPGRRFACPGLFSYRPSGTSGWLAALASGEWPNVPVISEASLRLARYEKEIASVVDLGCWTH